VPGVGGQVPQRQDAPAGRVGEAGRAVHGQEVEEDRVAGLQGEPADIESAGAGVDVGQFGQAPLREPARLPGQERPRHQPRAAVRAGHHLQAAAFGHRVNGDPGADAVPVHVVVRLVLMPRGALGGPGLLHQDVIVVEAQLRGGHQRCGDHGHPRAPGQLLDLRYLPPPAEVLSKRARVIGAAGDLGQRAAPGQDDVNRGGRGRHLPRAEDLPDAYDAIPGEGDDGLIISKNRLHDRTLATGDDMNTAQGTRPAPNTGVRRQACLRSWSHADFLVLGVLLNLLANCLESLILEILAIRLDGLVGGLLMHYEDLTEAERLVWNAFPGGGCVDLRSGDLDADDPASGGGWDGDRTVRGEVIRAVLLGAREPVHGAVAGLRITGARISGCVDLVHAEVRFPVHLERCWFEESPDLRWAVTRYLDLSGSFLPGLMADDLRVDGHLVLTGCRTGRGDATSAGGRTVPLPVDRALGRAVSATGITVGGGMFLNDGFTADGEVRLLDGHIGGVLDLGGAQLRNHGGLALLAARLTVDGPVFCREGFAADGEVVFRRAHITGFLDLSGARLSNPGGRALFAPVLTVDSGVFCGDGADFVGEVNLLDAHISGGLDLSSARLSNPGQTALSASRLTVEGSAFFRDGFTADGGVVLRRARITGFLDFSGARLSNPGGHALLAPGLVAEGGAAFRGGTAFDGRVSLEQARITEGLDLADARFTGPEKDELNCAHLTADQLIMPREPLAGIADLSHLRVGALTAHPDSTPEGIRVAELTYDTLAPMLPAGQRIRWITSTRSGYLPQPYEQLAASYRRLGHDADARTVLLAKERHRHVGLSVPSRLWGYLQEVTIGYGYRPGRAGLCLAALIAAGTVAFSLHHPAPAQSSARLEFNPFFYTLDLLLPIISYGQQSAFAPTGIYQWLSYALITAGWILATTIITGISRALYRG
jgi:hypothetical protein